VKVQFKNSRVRFQKLKDFRKRQPPSDRFVIGVAGMPEADGSIQAFSIHIFLSAWRGVVPDRHGPWDARPGSTMTNAYVQSAIAAKDGETLTVKYKGGAKKIIVTPQTMIAVAAPGKK
jgi:hypothetical protein